MALTDMLKDTCEIYIETVNAQTSMGAKPVTPTLVSTGVACRTEKINPDISSIIYAKFDTTKTYRVYFASDPQLTVKNWLVISGLFYRVISPAVDAGDQGVVFHVDVERKPSFVL